MGLTGAGKTTIGKALARRLGREFMDSDHVISDRTGVSVREIFEVEGEQGFRNREQAVICELATGKDRVLATGGGGILREATRECLKANCLVIYLYAKPEEIFKRIGHDHTRPMLDGNPLKRLQDLYQLRDPLYREVAHHVVETQGRSHQSLQDILAWLSTQGIQAMSPSSSPTPSSAPSLTPST